MTTVFAIVAAVWVLAALRLLRDVRSLRELPPRDERGAAPRVSVVIAARDEEARIETTLRNVLAQSGVDLELVVVDDRSSDRTGELVRRAAAADGRVTALRVDVLPEGWLGKCHACHVGAGRATGEWLLFTDGDIWMTPEVVARAVRAACEAKADHVTLLFGMSKGTLAGRACHLLASMNLAKAAARLLAARPRASMGIGAFNLVRAEAYRDVGGHEPLRLTVCDDWMLGLLLNRAGFRSRAYLAARDVEADWFGTPGAMVEALEKNWFASKNYRLGAVVAMLSLGALLWVVAAVGPFTGTPAGIAAGLGLLAAALPAAALARRLGMRWWIGLVAPFMFPMMLAATINSTYRTLRSGGIRWRDTFYPLDRLRAGTYR